MRSSIAGTTLLLAAGGTAWLAALDTTGNNVALAGSDALFDVTNAVIASCPAQFPDFVDKGITYTGGGTASGVTRMMMGDQRLAPISRSLKSPEHCMTSGTGTDPGLASELLVAVEGVAVVANRATT